MKGQPAISDTRLVESLKKGDLNAFNDLFAKYNKKLYYFAKGYLHSKEDAEELVQEVFIKVWENRKELKQDLSFKSFLFTITYNAIFNHYKKKSRENKYLDQILTDYTNETNETSKQVEYDNLLELAEQAIEKLPDKRKLVFKLSRYEGLSNKEIAGQLHLSKRTIENHIQQALKSLREQLGKELLFAILFLLLIC